MAWPLSPLTTYLPSSVPAIKAADLNAMQSFSVGVATGTVSLASMKLDGTGAAIIASPGAQILISPLSVNANSTPEALFQTGGTNQFLVDHNGFPMGPLSSLETNFLQDATMVSSSTFQKILDGSWFATTSASGSVANVVPDTTYYSNSANVTVGAAGGLFSYIGSFAIPTYWGDNCLFVLETEVLPSNPTNSSVFVGLSPGLGDPTAGFRNTAYFIKRSGDTFWNTVTGSSGSSYGPFFATSFDATDWRKFRIEFHGKNSPFGVSAIEGPANTAKIRFLINGVWQNTVAGGVNFPDPTAGFQMGLIAGGTSTGANTTVLRVGSMRACWARWLNAPAL